MKLPKYAENVPRQELVQAICRNNCGKVRYMKVSRTPWSKNEDFANNDLHATCLKCGGQANDYYNWIKV